MPKNAPVVRIPHEDTQIIADVANNNPELQALGFDIAGATAAKERANKEFLPDFSFGIDYIATDNARMPNIAGSGDDPVSAAFTMTLPIQRGKYRAGVQAAQARIAGEQARRDQHLNSLQASTVNALFRLRDAERQIDLYQTTLLPKANESLVATQRAYSSGCLHLRRSDRRTAGVAGVRAGRSARDYRPQPGANDIGTINGRTLRLRRNQQGAT